MFFRDKQVRTVVKNTFSKIQDSLHSAKSEWNTTDKQGCHAEQCRQKAILRVCLIL